MDQILKPERNPIHVSIGKNISRFRKELGLSQTTLATMIGISQQHLASIEVGVRRIAIEDLFKVAEVFKVSIVNLLPLIEDPKKPGPRPKLVVAYEKLTQLPEKEQNAVLVMIDSLSAKTKE